MLASLAHFPVDHLAALVASLGREAFLVKADVKETYRIMPVHPEDQYLLVTVDSPPQWCYKRTALLR